MKKLILFVIIVMPLGVLAQSDFSPDDFKTFISNNKNLTADQLLENHPLQTNYYSSRKHQPELFKLPWFDSINATYQLTADEQDLLKNNYFMVSERLSSNTWINAYADIYYSDLPLFLSTDFILFTLHQSYDNILKSIEINMLEPNLIELIEAMRAEFENVYLDYKENENIENSLKDVDLYLSVASSLINGDTAIPLIITSSELTDILDLVQAEKMVEHPLFTRVDLNRKLDFSQFTPRGHYTDEIYTVDGMKSLENYFRAMMWLGRIDFLLTAPPDNPWEVGWNEEDLLRMNLSALLLNEVLFNCGKLDLFEAHEEIISFMVGPDDNMTPLELKSLESSNISNLTDLLDNETFDSFTGMLNASDDYGQKIMSNFFFVDPDINEPSKLPISYKLLGQKFLIDSYVFSEVVFDRIVFNDEKQYRLLPDPLDILSVFGSEDAMRLMKPEMEEFKYAYKISELQYLVNSYDDEFWTQSLYNNWLSSLIELNPPSSSEKLPYFMQTTAWHHEKMNTQLTSWAQLRHDNILYGKQSYTGGTGCSYPYTYVEPYPEFYSKISLFAQNASTFFDEILPEDEGQMKTAIVDYYSDYVEIINKLKDISIKELNKTPLVESDLIFLKTMISDFMASGPGVSGWINELLFNTMDKWDTDYTVADVHTQPTEPGGAVVGNVLHVGNGNINFGVFIAPATTDPENLMCYVGPVSSFHSKVEKNFNRLNDDDWKKLFDENKTPKRPDWTYHYLADINGENTQPDNVLKGIEYTGIDYVVTDQSPLSYLLSFPNPASDNIHFRFVLNEHAEVSAEIYDISGRLISNLYKGHLSAGEHDISYELDGQISGVYYLKLTVNNKLQVSRFVVN